MKEMFINGKGYGSYTEEFKEDIKEADRVIAKAFKDLLAKGYKPSELCFEFIQSISCEYSIYAVRQGLEDHKKEIR
jgi:hypothetical protein